MSDPVGQVYDRLAPFYYWVFGFSLEGARKRAIAEARIRPHEKVLEVGVGNGMTFRHLPVDVDFTGIDLSEKMLAGAQKRAEELGRKSYKLEQMDATKLRFPDKSFDVVISAHFLSATSNPLPALQEMKRVVKDNGRILLVNNFQTPRTDTTAKVLEPLAQKMGFSMQLDIIDLANKTGLHILRRQRVSLVMPVDAVILIPDL